MTDPTSLLTLTTALSLAMFVAFLAALAWLALWLFHARRRGADPRFNSPELFALASRLGLREDLERMARTADGRRALQALTRCDACAGLLDCHGYLKDAAARQRPEAFCPNVRFIRALLDSQKRQTIHHHNV